MKRGLNITIPVVVLTSDKSSNPQKWDEIATQSDTVLNVKAIEKNAAKLGTNIIYHQIPNALHDVFLSRKAVRDEALAYCLEKM
ncbi:MAG: hypothetical protein RR141_06320 [Rikenellaceae bacterium]